MNCVSWSHDALILYAHAQSSCSSHVHRDGDYHKAVQVWIYVESTGELVLQKRADRKDSWPGLWDTSSAGHISAGDTSLILARYIWLIRL